MIRIVTAVVRVIHSSLYYFEEGEKSEQVRAAYLEHIAKMLTLTGSAALSPAVNWRSLFTILN
ncbi:hypothetical protein Mag101_00365 [Microbulbifer agarilyticus]|uniref:Uncharacterized protein n=1 Tax=Microbulbifer agarilyticus TaxID=260552 RepID=A0A1Q2M0Q7_9GAMM|nr:hypothetical protein [Microbulbifer agarilyticus]AQQ66273.1 hypothetical protein Mag101_00365 [Microbulbifer agarilyticus]